MRFICALVLLIAGCGRIPTAPVPTQSLSPSVMESGDVSQLPHLNNIHVFVSDDSLRYTATFDRDASGLNVNFILVANLVTNEAESEGVEACSRLSHPAVPPWTILKWYRGYYWEVGRADFSLDDRTMRLSMALSNIKRGCGTYHILLAGYVEHPGSEDDIGPWLAYTGTVGQNPIKLGQPVEWGPIILSPMFQRLIHA